MGKIEGIVAEYFIQKIIIYGASKRCGINIDTITTWARQYQPYGIERLKPKEGKTGQFKHCMQKKKLCASIMTNLATKSVFLINDLAETRMNRNKSILTCFNKCTYCGRNAAGY